MREGSGRSLLKRLRSDVAQKEDTGSMTDEIVKERNSLISLMA